VGRGGITEEKISGNDQNRISGRGLEISGGSRPKKKKPTRDAKSAHKEVERAFLDSLVVGKKRVISAERDVSNVISRSAVRIWH